jgi:hypothetical protein
MTAVANRRRAIIADRLSKIAQVELVACPFDHKRVIRMPARILTILCFALFGAVSLRAGKVTIENPKGLPVKQEEVTLLYTLVCQEVAESYHVKNYKDIEAPLTLVLGEERERYLIDHLTGADTIYLQQWNESHFAAAAVMIAFHHVLSNDRFQVVATKALKRFSKIEPETVTTARNRR